MKRILIYILTAGCLTGFTSCKKFLDVTASNQIKSEDLLSTEVGFKDALMGVYIGMGQNKHYGSMQTYVVTDILAQQYKPLINLSVYYQLQSYNYEHMAGRKYTDMFWELYKTIAGINNALNQMDGQQSIFNPINYKIIKGELLALRAYLHFDLMRLYGHENYQGRPELATFPAIPYVTAYSKEVTPQRSYTETFALILKDIQDAAELLKEDPVYPNTSRPADYYANVNRDGFYNNRNSRMNYYALKALEARVYTWMGGAANLQKAASAAREVIDNGPAMLINSSNSGSNDRAFAAEHIFHLEVYQLPLWSGALKSGSAADYNALFVDETTFNTVYELNDPQIGAVDKRQIVQFVQDGNGRTPVKLAAAPGQTPNKFFPMMRVSEMYYIEAEYELINNRLNAIQLLNEVRRSRGILKDIPDTATDEEVKQELTKEYQKDFSAEGQLFFYYKRNGFDTFRGLPSSIMGDDKLYMLLYPQNELELGNRVQ
jgi:hypothetical protein